MAGFEYKDGCLRCNQCGRLHDPARLDDSSFTGCPCGNNELLDALDGMLELYNGPRDATADSPPQPPAEPGTNR